MLYGNYTNEASRTSNTELKFGLNRLVLESVIYSPEKPDEQKGEYMAFKFDVHTEYLRPVSTVRVGDVEYKPGDKGYEQAAAGSLRKFDQRNFQLFRAFLDEETIMDYFSQPINSFEDFANVVKEMFTEEKCFGQPVHAFANYRWNKAPDDEIAKLEIGPKNMKHGLLYHEFLEGNWERVKNPDYDPDDIESSEFLHKGIVYIDKETGDRHPISRSSWFAESNYGDPRELNYD